MNWHQVPMPHPALVVMMGAPGSGKSTVVSMRFKPHQVLCLDTFRALASDDEGDQGATQDAVVILNQVLEIRSRRGLTTVIDATNSHPHIRRDLVDRVRGRLAPVALRMMAPLEDCITRQGLRDRKVPESVIRSIWTRLDAVRTQDLASEGFKLIVRVHKSGYYTWDEVP